LSSARADAPPYRTLAEYVRELVGRLGEADADAAARLRDAVAGRRARIRLDDEAVDVAFRDARLEVRKSGGRHVDGEGATDRGTVLDLMDGWIEVKDAILDGRLEVRGTPEDVHRIFVAIEILLDASARAPALQRLGRDFRGDPCRPPRGRPRPATRSAPWFPPRVEEAEEAMLERLGLLPDGPAAAA